MRRFANVREFLLAYPTPYPSEARGRHELFLATMPPCAEMDVVLDTPQDEAETSPQAAPEEAATL